MVGALVAVAVVAQAADAIPQRFRAVYRELESRLDRFERSLPRTGGGDVTFAAELLAANGNRGEGLLAPQAFAGTLLYLDRLQSLGVGGVTIQMPYPLLAPGFPRSEEYWRFYRKLADEIRRRELKLLAKTGPVFTQPEISPVRPDYSRLSWDDYLEGRSRIAERIEREIQPDYLTIANEPSTEAAVLGKEPLGEARYTRFVRETLSRLRRRRTLVGAGTGTWDHPAFVTTFARDTAVDYIDLHIYPLASRTTDFLRRTAEMAHTARRHRKRVIVGEFWLYKAAARELGGAPIQTGVFARDTFGFWSPLDAHMLRGVAGLARANGIEYVSAFWSKYFFATLDHATHANLAPGELLRASDREAARAMLAQEVSPTGVAYRDVIRAR